MKYFRILLFLFSFSAMQAQTTQTTRAAVAANFSGTFLLNRSKTDFGKLSANLLPVGFNILQVGDSVFITRLWMGSPAVQTDTLTVTKSSKIKFGAFDYVSLLSWSQDKSQFTVKRDVFIGKGMQVGKAIEVSYLEENGKTLVFDKTMQGSYNIKGIYDKQ